MGSPNPKDGMSMRIQARTKERQEELRRQAEAVRFSRGRSQPFYPKAGTGPDPTFTARFRKETPEFLLVGGVPPANVNTVLGRGRSTGVNG